MGYSQRQIDITSKYTITAVNSYILEIKINAWSQCLVNLQIYLIFSQGHLQGGLTFFFLVGERPENLLWKPKILLPFLPVYAFVHFISCMVIVPGWNTWNGDIQHWAKAFQGGMPIYILSSHNPLFYYVVGLLSFLEQSHLAVKHWNFRSISWEITFFRSTDLKLLLTI